MNLKKVANREWDTITELLIQTKVSLPRIIDEMEASSLTEDEILEFMQHLMALLDIKHQKMLLYDVQQLLACSNEHFLILEHYETEGEFNASNK